MNETNNQKWKDLGVKDQAALITALASFVLAFVLIFIGLFIDPAGVIDPTVLTGFGTALLYTAGIFGVTMYFKYGSTELFNNVMNAVDKGIEKRLDRNNHRNEFEEEEHNEDTY